MAEQVGLSQESCEVNFHDDWTDLAPSINEILKQDHLKAALESLETDENAVPLALPENYFELEDQTNSLWTVPDVVEENPVPICKNISSVRKESSIDHDGDTDELNLSYNANSCSQVSLDSQEDAEIYVRAADLSNYDHDSINIAFQTKDGKFEADSLQINCKESSPINSIECIKAHLSDTLSHNSCAESLNTDDMQKRELSCSTGRSEIIQEEIKNVDDSSIVCTAEKQNIVVTKPDGTEKHKHSEAPVKYKPQFGNKKRKPHLSEETGEKQSKVQTATESVLAIETCSIKVASAENDSTTITDETAATEDNRAGQSSTESISRETAEAATAAESNKDSSATNEPKATTGENELFPIDKTAKFKNETVQSKGKPYTVGSIMIDKSVLTKGKKTKNSKTTSESVSRKGKKSAASDSKLGKGKAKASMSMENQNSTIVPNSSLEKEQKSTGIKYFLEHQESLARARNLLRCEKQKNESKRTEMSVTKAGFEKTFEDTMQNTCEEKLKMLDGEVSLLETLVEQVKSLTEGEEDHDKCLSLFGNIRDKVSASLLLKYPVVVAVLEPIQRYEIDKRIKEEAEEIYQQLNSMYIKQNMEDFVFNFDRNLKLHNQRLAKSERLAQKILKRVLIDCETNTELTFDIDMWSNLAKERNSVWDRFIQEFRESDKTTTFQNASGSNSQTSNVKEEVEELNNAFKSAVLNSMTQEQQETRNVPQASHSRTSRKASQSSLKSNAKQAELIVKPEYGVNNNVDVKPASNKLFVRIKEETFFKNEAMNTKKELQRKQPTRSRKLQNIKRAFDELIRVKQEIDFDTEIVNIKIEKQQKLTRRSSKSITTKEVEELNNDFNSAVLSTMTQEQQETRRVPQPSSSRTSRKASHFSLKSNAKQAELMVKHEYGVNNDVDVKPASNKLFVRIKEETVFNNEAMNTNKELQRKQPTRSLKLQNIKRAFNELIRVKQEIDFDTEIVNIKNEVHQKLTRRSSKSFTTEEEVTSGHEQIVRIKKEIDSDTDTNDTSRGFPRIQPRRSCKPSKGKLELKMHFAKRKSYFDKEREQMSKRARVSSD